ncbi:MAG: lipopolysaccharide biosynthesis protein [Gemmatimonadales bacterium]
MAAETMEIARPAGGGETETQRERTLTGRASLNVVQSLLDYSVKLGVGLVIVPILVTGLGRTLFGVWEMLGRLVGYIESADGRSTQALRLVIANQQSSDDHSAKRRWIGSALAVWVCFLPLWATAGALLIWLTPTVTSVPEEFHAPVRVACALMMGAVLLAGLGSLPESVLRGMNLGYKRMGLQAGLSLVGGALLATAIYAGGGLVGVAGAGLVLAALTGLCFLVLVRRQVPWFGAERPRLAEVGSMLGMSVWLALGDVVSKLLASDVLVLGMVSSATAVTTYVLTGYAARLALNLHSLSAEAVMPGLAGVIGDRSFERATLLRRELLAVTALFVTAVGSAILLCNRSFVHLWVGAENYAGAWTNLLIVLIAVQSAFIRCDAYLIDSALQPGRRVRVGIAAGILTLVLSVGLTHLAGMVGLCIGILAGRATQSIGYPLLVRQCLNRSPGLSLAWLLRPLLVMSLLFAGAAYWGENLLVGHWLSWAALVAVTLILAFAIALGLGLPRSLRGAVVARIVEMARRLGGARS